MFIPVIGTILEFKQCEKKHEDIFYAVKKRLRENPELRFVASPHIDKCYVELYDPELIKEFLNKAHMLTVKDTSVFATFSEFLLNGLVFAEGDLWKEQRKHLSKVFHFEYMSKSMGLIDESAVEWINSVASSNTISEVNVSKGIKDYTATVIWRVLFGQESSYEKQEMTHLVDGVIRNNATAMDQALSPWNMVFGPKFFKLGLRAKDRQHNREHEVLKKTFYGKLEAMKAKIIEKKANQVTSNEADGTLRNLIELLLEQAIREGGLSDLEIVSQVFTFYAAGADTTGELIALTHYYLAENPGIQEKLREEILTHIGKSEAIQYEHLMKMEYLSAVIKETLRMGAPAAGLFFRKVKEDFMIKDLKLEKGFIINVPVPCLGFNPKYFSDVNVYRPERWLEKKDVGTVDPFAYMPFSTGVRRCIGEQMALIDAKLLLCEVLRRFKVDIKRPYKLKMGVAPVHCALDPIIAIYTPI